MKKYLFIVVGLIIVYGIIEYAPNLLFIDKIFSPEISQGDIALEDAFEKKLSNIQVGGSGKVIKILRDDTQGRRHQKFIIELNSGQTLLIAHNIDISPRINSLRVGDKVDFYGEYEWNANGGVVHWTHHDPRERHEGGWIDHGGKRYQ